MGGRGVSGRIGLLGGTFDPPHIGHLWLAALAADELELERVLFVLASQPPHKRDEVLTGAEDRAAMTRLAIADEPRFELSRIELERPGVSYTVDTVSQLLDSGLAGDDLILIMAADTLAEIGSWREPERLLSLVRWAVGPRPGSPGPDRDELRTRFGPEAGRITFLAGPALEVSSTEIRDRVAAGRTIRYLVPRAVEELILERRLYRHADA
jgi:nicotinate-nucleotide adenylyltransferase